MTKQPVPGLHENFAEEAAMSTDKAMVTDSPMQFFSENVDSWGAAEWFDRLAKAVRSQDEVCGLMHRAPKEDKWSYEASFETYRNIASSSALRLVRDYEHQIRAALAQAEQPVAVKPLEWRGPDCGFYEADTIGGVVRIMDGLRDEPGRFIYNPASGNRTKFDTLEKAKAAAQADYERRIISALAHPPSKREAAENNTPSPVQHVVGSEPVAWRVTRYDKNGSWLDTTLHIRKPEIASTSRTDIEPLYLGQEASTHD